jgi:hypothetical protein
MDLIRKDFIAGINSSVLVIKCLRINSVPPLELIRKDFIFEVNPSGDKMLTH